MEPVEPAPGTQVPPLPFNVRIDFLDANGVRKDIRYVRVKEHNFFGTMTGKVCRITQKGDPNQYDWCTGRVTLYEYDHGRRVQMWEYGLPVFGHVVRITAQPKLNSAF